MFYNFFVSLLDSEYTEYWEILTLDQCKELYKSWLYCPGIATINVTCAA